MPTSIAELNRRFGIDGRRHRGRGQWRAAEGADHDARGIGRNVPARRACHLLEAGGSGSKFSTSARVRSTRTARPYAAACPSAFPGSATRPTIPRRQRMALCGRSRGIWSRSSRAATRCRSACSPTAPRARRNGGRRIFGCVHRATFGPELVLELIVTNTGDGAAAIRRSAARLLQSGRCHQDQHRRARPDAVSRQNRFVSRKDAGGRGADHGRNRPRVSGHRAAAAN